MTTPRIPVADARQVNGLADAVMSGRPTIPIQSLADLLGIDYTRLKKAAAAGDLPIVRVSPRRLVVTRAGLVAYLSQHNRIDGAPAETQPGSAE